MNKKGIWLSPTNFASFSEGRGRPLARQIATRDRSPDFSRMAWLPNPDPILKRQGSDIRVYRDLLSDAHVGGCVRRRVAAVKALSHGIEQESAKTRAAKRIEVILKRLPLGRIIGDMLQGALFGYQPLEIMWGTVDGLTAPLGIVAKPPEWFLFDAEGELRFRSRDKMLTGEELPPRKFLLARQDADYANPYGIGELSRCFWPATFKKNGLRFWVTFAEKYGTPWLVGKMPKSAPEGQVSGLLDSLEAMIGDAVAVIPDDSSIDIVESGSKGASSEVFNQLLMYCRAEISTALLGQNQATEASSTHASATAGLEVTRDLRDGMAAMVAEELNRLIGWIYELNHLPGDPPSYAFWEPEEVDKAQAERDQILSNAGVRFSKSYWMRSYDLREDDIEDQGEPIPSLEPEPEPELETDADLAEGAANSPPWRGAEGGVVQNQPQPNSPPWRGAEGGVVQNQPQPNSPPWRGAEGGVVQEQPKDPIDDLIEEAMSEWEPALDPMLDPLRQALEHAKETGETAGDLLARLPDLLRLMDDSALTELLTRTAFAANLAGQAGLELEGD